MRTGICDIDLAGVSVGTLAESVSVTLAMHVHEVLGYLGCVALLYTAEPVVKGLPSGWHGGNHACEHPEEKPSGQAALPLAPVDILVSVTDRSVAAY